MATCITDESLKTLVALFYGRVRQDPDLGPIFNDAVHDWPVHLEKLTDFWSSVMLTTGRYKGNPMMKHLIHQARITPAHFKRWLTLWAEATAEVMPPEDAALLQAKAARIGESLSLALFHKLEPARPRRNQSVT
jgi:hemoglobin